MFAGLIVCYHLVCDNLSCDSNFLLLLFLILNSLDLLYVRYGGTITNQIRRLGASCDWTREHFTLDEQLSRKAVFY